MRLVSVAEKVILSLTLLENLILALEEHAPEVFLSPRNFNPHPYEIGYNGIDIDRHQELVNRIDRGPVLFPDDNRVNTDPYVVERVKQHHPYSDVKRKHKIFRLGFGRYHQEENDNPQVYNALAAHGAKVLKIPQAKDLKQVPNFDYDYLDTHAQKPYEFSYKVLDHATGDDFSHIQRQNTHSTHGEYRVKLPDGRLQIVSYTADKNGYKADVKYAEAHFAPPPPPPPPPSQIYVSPSISPLAVKTTGQHNVYKDLVLILPNKYHDDTGDVIPDKVVAGEKVALGKFIAATLAPPSFGSSGATSFVGPKGLGHRDERLQHADELAPDFDTTDNFNPFYIETSPTDPRQI